jgi:hypothetical protein
MTILQNALAFLRYEADNSPPSHITSGAELVGRFEALAVSELKERLSNAGLSSSGTKSELIVKLALWTHKSEEMKAGHLNLLSMKVPELRELKQGLGLKGTAQTKADLVDVLEKCLKA